MKKSIVCLGLSCIFILAILAYAEEPKITCLSEKVEIQTLRATNAQLKQELANQLFKEAKLEEEAAKKELQRLK